MLTRERTVEEIMLTEEGRFLELYRGQLREKPTDMSENHNRLMNRLGIDLGRQLDRQRFEIRINSGRVRRDSENYFIPDVYVIPLSQRATVRIPKRGLETIDRPLALVVEVWSPSTGKYDDDEKLPEYQARGDREIWRIHPDEFTVTVWRRQADGTYSLPSIHSSGVIEPVALPGVAIDLDALFS